MPNDLYNDLPLTNFPTSLDQFTTWIDIIASDGPLIAQYQSAMESGNITLANQILARIPQGSQKIITAVDLNTLSQAMLALERFYKSDIQPYVENLQEGWLNTIQRFSYKGEWASGTSYLLNNMVSYTVNGIRFLFIATQNPPVGTVPTVEQFWRVLTIQGEKGESGQGLSYREEWKNSTLYETDDVVSYNNAVWIALQQNQNREPTENSVYWKSIINLKATTYPIQSTEPPNLQVDGLWFNTSDNPTNYIYEGSVAEGKTLIAAAITAKGVPTNPNDSFAQMAANINAIK